MKKTDPPNPFSAALTDWKVSPRRDPQFRDQVWRRISERQRNPAWTSYLRAHATTAASLALVATLAGAWTGYAQARAQAEQHREKMVTAYVESIDVSAPLKMP